MSSGGVPPGRHPNTSRSRSRDDFEHPPRPESECRGCDGKEDVRWVFGKGWTFRNSTPNVCYKNKGEHRACSYDVSLHEYCPQNWIIVLNALFKAGDDDQSVPLELSSHRSPLPSEKHSSE